MSKAVCSSSFPFFLNCSSNVKQPEIRDPKKWGAFVLKQSKSTKEKIFNKQLSILKSRLMKIDPELVNEKRYEKMHPVLDFFLNLIFKVLYFVSRMFHKNEIELIKPRYQFLQKALEKTKWKKDALHIVLPPVTPEVVNPDQPLITKIAANEKIEASAESAERMMRLAFESLPINKNIIEFFLVKILLPGIIRFDFTPSTGEFRGHYSAKRESIIKELGPNPWSTLALGAKLCINLQIHGRLTDHGLEFLNDDIQIQKKMGRILTVKFTIKGIRKGSEPEKIYMDSENTHGFLIGNTKSRECTYENIRDTLMID